MDLVIANFRGECEKGALLWLLIYPSIGRTHPNLAIGRLAPWVPFSARELADLPNQYRSQFGFMMLMGITPAPHEPPGVLFIDCCILWP